MRGRAGASGERGARWLPRTILITDLALLVAAALLLLPDLEATGPVVALGIAVAGWGGVGALIATRVPRTAIGWLLLTAATAGAYTPFAAAYASWGLTHPADLPLAGLIGWSSLLVVGPIGLASIPLLFLLYPDGALPSPRWRAVALGLVAMAPLMGLNGLANGSPEQGLFPPSWAGDAFQLAGVVGTVGLLVGVGAALLSLWLRMRRAAPHERGPLRWLFVLLTAMVAIVPIGVIVGSFTDPWVGFVLAGLVIVPGVLFGIPFAFSIVLLRYGLYDFEVRTRKRVVAALLSITLTVVTTFVLVMITQGLSGAGLEREAGTGAGLLVGAATAIVVWILFRTFSRFSRRVVFSGRATPHEVLSEFSGRLGSTYSTDDVLPRMAQLLAAGTGARRATVWLRVDDELRVVAAWPPSDEPVAPLGLDGTGLPAFPGGIVGVPVVHDDALLGAITLVTATNDPMTPAKERLTQDLAAQAGLVLRNVALVEDLRESRRRIVAAQDERARKLERDLHDGAQQQLVALAVKLQLVETMLDRDPDRARGILGEVRQDAGDALANLRDLARGIYPPLLADQGLGAALAAQARKAALPVRVTADLPRYSADVEAAVYFCVLEAVSNATKYAGATAVAVDLDQVDGRVGFTVTDDGVGFDPADAAGGTGLQGMADRIAAVGGAFAISSVPGHGTAVRGSVPVGRPR